MSDHYHKVCNTVLHCQIKIVLAMLINLGPNPHVKYYSWTLVRRFLCDLEDRRALCRIQSKVRVLHCCKGSDSRPFLKSLGNTKINCLLSNCESNGPCSVKSGLVDPEIFTFLVIKVPYSGKLGRALNLANQSSECTGEFKFGDCEPFRIE